MNRLKRCGVVIGLVTVFCIVFTAFTAFALTEKPDSPVYKNPELPIEERIEDLLGRMSLVEKVDEICGKDFMDGKTNRRLGIPALLMTDGPHGIRDMYGKATCFPTLVTLGCTWDEDLTRKVGVVLGKETRAKGRNLILGPCINIHRTPLGGRNFESFGEDPHLIGKIAAAYVKGVQSEKIGTSTKHFAANNQEWERMNISVEIDERALREIYLPGFKAAVQEADTYTIMAAYNKINGSYCCENSHLLIDILKNEWGFQGFVVSDWWAIHNGIKAANEGCDMEMPGPGHYFMKNKILKAIKNNQVKESVIDDKVRRILRVKYKLGLFDGEGKRLKGAANAKEHQDLAREVAEGGIILLKNENNVLPLDSGKIKTIAVIGPNSLRARVGGGGSSRVDPPYSVSPMKGLKNKCGREITVHYSKGCNMPGKFTEIPSTAFQSADDSKMNGLKGEYFNNISFKGEPVFTRMDKKIGFDWGENSPGNSLGKDNFSVRWTGKLIPPKSGNYELCLLSDDGSRLYVDDKLIVNNWGDHGSEMKKGKIKLTAGQEYDVRLEYYESGGGSVMKFGWVVPGDDMKKAAVKIAKKADAAILFVGLSYALEGEGVDRKNMKLPKEQNELIKAV
ncbi:MAG: glycoside hydrolase family 3 C-terminal domain-containing protein, partial [Candidatus Omnitrophica bacterium]|nr:glycoside hydrolase family 3 C-terminal domain-containing protein [Candidatus Omnitrophota bacterium]